LYNDTGGDLKVGLVEPPDSQNIKFKYDRNSESFTKTFYSNGVYTTSSSPVSSYGMSYMIRDVIDYINDTYDKDQIVWYDVFRRMTLSQMGQLMYDSNIELFSQLERGYRDGVKINYVINTVKDTSQYILPDDDKVIIKKEDR